MAFLTEDKPVYGQATQVARGIMRIVANNPGPMTYHGTNTYLIAAADGTILLDPGPDLATHADAVLQACGHRLDTILLTHHHADHAGLVGRMQAATGAKLAGSPALAKFGIAPDRPLGDGDRIGSLEAVATPGHASDHLCFSLGEILFSGDHVMSWSTTVINPPDGDMSAYLASLRRLLSRDDRLYLPGHGPPIPSPHPFLRALLAHRVGREAAILGLLDKSGGAEIAALTGQLYAGVAPSLLRAAERNTLAHLLKLQAEGRADLHQGVWHAVDHNAGRLDSV